MLFEGDTSRKRWKNLRNSHAKCIRNQKTKSGHAAGLKQKWIWADQMDFFKNFLAFAKTSSNVTTLETFQDEQNYLEPDVTSEIIVQSGKNMYIILNMFNL